ncbi:hypothetical protein LRS10_13625 [Phenylobacterium sp. J426]|uniref:hypothetical protein n=1 Tax=Phenylobacterium sp. J426 TaxID=2898439 RepID=UPI002151B522|nr:hypothetical protein [Phenylobacterium sp. J426]MCR5875133.1 hypothetical protein [Phenylobacterium sp. J426]
MSDRKFADDETTAKALQAIRVEGRVDLLMLMAAQAELNVSLATGVIEAAGDGPSRETLEKIGERLVEVARAITEFRDETRTLLDALKNA